jgi:NADH-quinone oxidoreductase subunit C/D
VNDASTPISPAAAPQQGMHAVVGELRERFPSMALDEQPTADGIPTLWLSAQELRPALAYLKGEAPRPYRTLWDLCGIDERLRTKRAGQPPSDFTAVYHLLSYERNADVRLKVPLRGEQPAVPTVTDLWPAADWYERELWDMFGVGVDGHPNLRRILSPPWLEGHPLRKEHPGRGTELGPFLMSSEQALEWQEDLAFRPEEWGLQKLAADPDVMFLNVGPQHGGTHGVVHITIGLRDEEIVACVLDIGYHHRAQEKVAERQSWHTYIPYTDRVDYLAGVQNNLNYLLSVEKLAGIEVPDRAQVIRVMLCELYRINSHLLYYGTYAQDIGALSPVFYMFSDRELIHDITQAICGARMHPNWFRIGGVAEDLPKGWDTMVREFLDYMPARLKQYDRLVVQSSITRARTRGVGALTLDEAVEWGVSGPNLRACGLEFDYRKKRPYSGYEHFDFEIPTATSGDSYDRLLVRIEEMRQSLRIIRQCLDHMPSGPYKSHQQLATPPVKEPNTMHDIESLIDHFLGVSWGPVVPAGEAVVPAESMRGATGYYCVSDGNTGAYRMHIRTPSFPHLQALPLMCLGLEVPDLITILGSLDFVMADVDR